MLEGLSDRHKIGITLLGLGFLLLVLGILLFFDSGLLFLGNICLLSGFPFILGFDKTLNFFNPIKRKDRRRGILLFFAGVLLVLMRWSFVGICVELYGLAAMFLPFIADMLKWLRTLPYVGSFFGNATVQRVIARLAGKQVPGRAAV